MITATCRRCATAAIQERQLLKPGTGRRDRKDIGMIENCFGLKHGVCRVLVEMNDCEHCPFYKSKNAVKAMREEAMERLRSLPLPAQLHISDKYYENEMPWM